MYGKLEKFESGWVGVSFALTDQEIESLIERLRDLKSHKIDHFHFRANDFSGNEAIADVEFSRLAGEHVSDLVIE